MLAEKFEDGCDRIWSYLSTSSAGFIAVCLALFAYLSRATGADPDLFARVAMGRMIELLGSVPRYDPFSYTAEGALWIDHEWLSGVIFYFIASRFGDFGLYLFAFLMACYSFCFLLRAAQLESRSTGLNVFFFCIMSFACSVVWLSPIRSQLFTYFFLPYLLYAIKKYECESQKRWILTLPVVMLVWANAHGGFVTGLGLLWVYCVLWILQKRKGARLFAGITLGASLSVLINPYGLLYLSYILHAVTMPRPNIPEWFPLSFLSGEGMLVLALISCTLLAIWRNRNSVSLEGFVIMGLSLSQALSHFRLSPLFFMTFLVYGSGVMSCVAQFLEESLTERFQELRRAFCVVLLGAAVYGLSCFSFFIMHAATFHLRYDSYPLAALCWLKNSGLSGRVLVDFNQGSFALWRLHPQFLVSLDGRYEEVYSDKIVMAVDAALSPGRPDFQESLKLVYPDFILLDSRRPEHQEISSFGPEWRELYADDTYKILTNFPETIPHESEPNCDLSGMWVPGF